ncbi:MAG: RagB/SusD family nutrient uptake outer membrane protein [Agriterribacter sp.]
MKNKFIIYILCTCIAGLTSCKKFLETTPETSLTTGNAYNSASDIENAIVGAYNIFYKEYYIWDNVLLGDLRSDNAYTGGSNDQAVLPYDLLTIPAGNSRMLFDWQQLYEGIARCNIILNKIGDVTDVKLDADNRRNEIIGEASFLRAFHYFQLVKTFGGVPIELNSNSADPEKTNLARSTETEVYDQIVKDLEVAITNLPDAYGDDPPVNKVKATKGAANALMAKIWAQRSDRDYSKVLTYCNAVISSAAGYHLLENYADLFDGDHYTNDESILEVPFIANTELANWGVQLYLAPEDGWQKYCVPSKDLVAKYDSENDEVRKNANIIFINNLDWADENWNPCQDYSVYVPFNYKQKHPNAWSSGDHQYLLRLADIITLKAEAQNETGDLAGAAATLNLIRSRVQLPDVEPISKEQMKTAILDERRLELAFEGQRWDDLVRNSVAVNVMNALQEVKYTCEGGIESAPVPINYNCNNDKLICPIPQLERDANPNLTQNPGY